MKGLLFYASFLVFISACAENDLESKSSPKEIANMDEPKNTDDLLFNENWKEIDHVSGRIANEEDMKVGRAVFFSKSGTTPYEMPLPALAIHADEETKEETKVVIIQAETGPEGVIIGAIYPDGSHLLATLEEFQVIENASP